MLIYFGAPSLGVPGGGSNGCSRLLGPPGILSPMNKDMFFLLGLSNLESGSMSLKLILMIKFIPVMESTLHHRHWNTE